MYSRTTTIINKTGLHARPASDFVAQADKFASKISIARVNKIDEDDDEANAKSIVMLLSMGLSKGTEVEISAKGVDEKEAVDTLVEMIESGFGE